MSRKSLLLSLAGMALLLGAFIIHGLQPGPLLMTQNPGLFWGVIASMYIGNVMLLVLNLPLTGQAHRNQHDREYQARNPGQG